MKPPVDAPMSSASRPVDGDAEGVERVRELDAAAPDVRMVGRDQRDVGGRVDRRAGLGCGLPVDADLAGEDQRARPLARRREAAFDDELVQADAQFLQP